MGYDHVIDERQENYEIVKMEMEEPLYIVVILLFRLLYF